MFTVIESASHDRKYYNICFKGISRNNEQTTSTRERDRDGEWEGGEKGFKNKAMFHPSPRKWLLLNAEQGHERVCENESRSSVRTPRKKVLNHQFLADNEKSNRTPGWNGWCLNMWMWWVEKHKQTNKHKKPQIIVIKAFLSLLFDSGRYSTTLWQNLFICPFTEEKCLQSSITE